MPGTFNQKAAAYVNMLLEFNAHHKDGYFLEINGHEGAMCTRFDGVRMTKDESGMIVICLPAEGHSVCFLLKTDEQCRLLTLAEAKEYIAEEMK